MSELEVSALHISTFMLWVDATLFITLLFLCVIIYATLEQLIPFSSITSIILRWGRFAPWDAHPLPKWDAKRQPPRLVFFEHLMLVMYGRSEKNAPLAFQLHNVPRRRSTSWALSYNPQYHFWYTGNQIPEKVQTAPQVRPQVLLLSVFIFILNFLAHHQVIES